MCSFSQNRWQVIYFSCWFESVLMLRDLIFNGHFSVINLKWNNPQIIIFIFSSCKTGESGKGAVSVACKPSPGVAEWFIRPCCHELFALRRCSSGHRCGLVSEVNWARCCQQICSKQKFLNTTQIMFRLWLTGCFHFFSESHLSYLSYLPSHTTCLLHTRKANSHNRLILGVLAVQL